MLQEWSGPSIFLSMVKCFSTMDAPLDSAAMQDEIPMVWSEKPLTGP